MIDLYFWPTPNGWKASIALEEMELPYTTHLVNIREGDQFKPEFLKISPNNRMPAIVDSDGPDGAPVSVFESGAILMYLARKTGKFYGRTERDRIAVEEWLKYAPNMEPPQDLPYPKDRYRTEVARLYGVLDRRLAENEYVAGDFYSIADISIWGWASLWEGQQQVLDDKPHFARWLEVMSARPAVQAGRALHAELRTGNRGKQAQSNLFKR